MYEKFTFVGFVPSNEVKTFLKEILWLIEGKSPNAASSSGSIRKIGNRFEGELKIASKVGTFLVNAAAETPVVLIEDLYSKIRVSLNEWIQRRSPIIHQN